MKKVIAKLSKKELDAIIQEEYAKMKKVLALKNKKESLQEEIRKLKAKHGLTEVKASGHKDKGDAYYMKGLPVQDFEEKRNASGYPALKEDEDMMDLEIGMDSDMGADEKECGEIETMFAELGRKLDDLLAGQADLSDDHDELAADHDALGADDEIEVSVDDEVGDDEEIEVTVGDDDLDECGTDKMEESEESEESEVIDEQDADAEESEETIDEQDGESVVSAADKDKVNPNLEKVDNKNPMADELYEGKQPQAKRGARLNPDNNPIINEELERMRKLARL